jgi:hypothetical protein
VRRGCSACRSVPRSPRAGSWPGPSPAASGRGSSRLTRYAWHRAARTRRRPRPSASGERRRCRRSARDPCAPAPGARDPVRRPGRPATRAGRVLRAPDPATGRTSGRCREPESRDGIRAGRPAWPAPPGRRTRSR